MVQTSAWTSCNAGYGFPLSSKTNISKFQFDLESGRRRTTLWMCYLQISIYLFSRLYYSLLTKPPILGLNSGLLIFRGKKRQNFAGFSGANSQKNGPISRDFCGKKVKIRGKSADFTRFSREKSQKFAEKSADFAGFQWKKIKFQRTFRDKFLEKSADFTGNFRGNFAKKQSVKNSRFRWIFFGKFR